MLEARGQPNSLYRPHLYEMAECKAAFASGDYGIHFVQIDSGSWRASIGQKGRQTENQATQVERNDKSKEMIMKLEMCLGIFCSLSLPLHHRPLLV
jgi:hypothetical protein